METCVVGCILVCAAMGTQDFDNYLLVTDEVYLDISIGGVYEGTITIGLLGDDLPKTVANFMALANHTYGYGYRGSPFHWVKTRYLLWGGDFQYGNGSGGYSIYGQYFDDESFVVKHDGQGWVTMANAGRPDTNAASFAIAMYDTHAGDRDANMDGDNVGFGRVVDGMNTVHAIDELEVDSNYRPLYDVIISDCGAATLPLYRRYWLDMNLDFRTLPYDSNLRAHRNGVGRGQGCVAIALLCWLRV